YTRSFHGSPSASKVPPKSNNTAARSFAIKDELAPSKFGGRGRNQFEPSPSFLYMWISPTLYHRFSICKSLRILANYVAWECPGARLPGPSRPTTRPWRRLSDNAAAAHRGAG